MLHLAITWATILQFTTEKNSKLFAASAAIKYNLTKEGHLMCDFFDDFEDDFIDDDQFEDGLENEAEMDEPSFDCSDLDGAPEKAESQDDNFTAKDAFILGGAMGFAYEEGLREGKRRRRKKCSDNPD